MHTTSSCSRAYRFSFSGVILFQEPESSASSRRTLQRQWQRQWQWLQQRQWRDRSGDVCVWITFLWGVLVEIIGNADTTTEMVSVVGFIVVFVDDNVVVVVVVFVVDDNVVVVVVPVPWIATAAVVDNAARNDWRIGIATATKAAARSRCCDRRTVL